MDRLLFFNKEDHKNSNKEIRKIWKSLFHLFIRILENNFKVMIIGSIVTISTAIINYNIRFNIKSSLRKYVENGTVANQKYTFFIRGIPFFSKSIHNLGFKNFVVVLFSISVFLKGTISIFHSFINNFINGKLEKDLRLDFFSHFIDAKFDKSFAIAPKIITQINSNIDGISDNIWMIPNRFVYVAVALLLNFYFDILGSNKSGLNSPKQVIILLSVLCSSAFFVYYLLKKSSKESVEFKRRYGSDNNFLYERISNLSLIKSNSSEELEKRKTEEKLNHTFSVDKLSFAWLAILRSLPIYLIIPSVPWICWILLFLTEKNVDSLLIVDLIFYYDTVRDIFSEIEKVITSTINGDRMFSDLELISETLNELSSWESEVKESELLEEFGDISLKNLSFSYPLRPNIKIIDKLDFVFENGKKYGIVGKNGAGKSTIIKVILKLFEYSSGQILIANQDFKNLEKKSIHEQTCRLTNNPSFFNATIAENVFYPYLDEFYANKDHNLKILKQAAKEVMLSDFISSLPLGIETVIKRGGLDLSEGQKQQIEAMKVFIRPHSLYLFDEILS
ncbi:MAG TPA: ABC transporter ATP-binding protein, partial [Mycoplasmatales bacterium]|nr:ABC transporter ATP-binding protein [Mycoplasmatales bacterium]